MSVQPVISANSHAIHQQMEANLRATSSGLSSVASSMTSSSNATTSDAAPASDGFCAKISAWVSSIVEGIRNCLANLPLIGSFFGSTTATSAQSTGATSVDPLALADANLVNILRSIYKPAPEAASSAASVTVTLPAVPGDDIQNFVMGQFNGIQTPAAKWEALAVVLSACNSTDAIGQQYFTALAPEMQDQFKGEMYRVNGSSVFPAGGRDHGAGFGHYMVAHQIRSDVAIQSAQNLQANPVTP